MSKDTFPRSSLPTFPPGTKFGLVDGKPWSFSNGGGIVADWSDGTPVRASGSRFMEDADLVSEADFRRAIAASVGSASLPEFSSKAVFGVMPDGRLAVEDGPSTRSWPDGKIVSWSLFREDADVIPRDEFMRRIAALHAGR